MYIIYILIYILKSPLPEFRHLAKILSIFMEYEFSKTHDQVTKALSQWRRVNKGSTLQFLTTSYQCELLHIASWLYKWYERRQNEFSEPAVLITYLLFPIIWTIRMHRNTYTSELAKLQKWTVPFHLSHAWQAEGAHYHLLPSLEAGQRPSTLV